jgi:hypothetical protein
MKYFLLAYDRVRGEILVDREYTADARDRALVARAELIERLTDPNVEVVLLGADSREDLRKTHGRYFMSLREAAAAH